MVFILSAFIGMDSVNDINGDIYLLVTSSMIHFRSILNLTNEYFSLVHYRYDPLDHLNDSFFLSIQP